MLNKGSLMVEQTKPYITEVKTAESFGIATSVTYAHLKTEASKPTPQRGLCTLTSPLKR